ncbi:MAG: D-aminoacyl-tRNA deacylase [Thermoanaerobaculia bacterium]|nr:D-aminoacyl-tRNA deacylase [Thermoanaerobaculia bacterium]
MRLVLQRVSRASVRVDGETVGAIGRGLVVLVGVEEGDGVEQAEKATRKLSGLRIFEDDDGKMNLGPRETGAALLVVPQFTLAASLSKGRRPSFARAAAPDVAEPLVEEIVRRLREEGLGVETGRFGVFMEVELVNDGPVTLVLDVDEDGNIP